MRLQKLTKECVKEYTTSFYNFLSSNVLHECPPWLVFQYVEGLRQDIEDELCGHSFDTVGEVAGEAEAAEKRLFNKKPKHETSPAIKNTNPPLLITPVSKHGIQPSTFKNLQRSLKCSASGKQGHLPFECPTSHVQCLHMLVVAIRLRWTKVLVDLFSMFSLRIASSEDLERR